MFKLGYTSVLKYTPDLDGSKGQHCLKSPDLQEINGKLFYLAYNRGQEQSTCTVRERRDVHLGKQTRASTLEGSRPA